jgi:hypothetical protein
LESLNEKKKKKLVLKQLKKLRNLKKKTHSLILLSFSDGVLREVVNEEIAVGLWEKLKSLYMKKSLTYQEYINLYS